MPCRIWFAVLALAMNAAPLRAADTPDSPNCRRALEALDRQEQQVATAHGTAQQVARGRLAALRRDAARACLGASDDARPPPRTVRPPIEIAPPAAVVPPRASTASPPPAVPRAPPPAVVTGCDATGCWASDGTRLQRLGPDRVGPRGVCSVQGTLLQCPTSR